jgi:hypothetical protein
LSAAGEALKALQLLGPIVLPHVKDWLDGGDGPQPPELLGLPDMARMDLELERLKRRRAQGKSDT